MEKENGRKRCAVAIPVYKPRMSAMEERGMRQCAKVLGGRDIYIVAPAGLDIGAYTREAAAYGVGLNDKRFAPEYFAGVEGYNRLMLNGEFYRAFEGYEYVLICQLDAYIFADELDYWCGEGYDYIGAPWFDGFGSHAEGELMGVGNGGLSLRRVGYFVRLLNDTGRRMYGLRHLPAEGLINKIKYQLGGYNTIESEIARNTLNEDHFYCLTLRESLHAPRLPEALTAARFAFEQSPSYLYAATGGKLPMGCHAYEKYEWDTFWRPIIEG